MNVNLTHSSFKIPQQYDSVFDFLGFQKAPDANPEQYHHQVRMGLYPPEIQATIDNDNDDADDDSSTLEELVPPEPVLPWTYTSTHDPSTRLNLVEELLHLIIILITVSR